MEFEMSENPTLLIGGNDAGHFSMYAGMANRLFFNGL
jgi:hypothetical protein